jgi:3-hydroxymyristoyl/3-hydroxydecanoyl-(acyl carrier protein) dehydratase
LGAALTSPDDLCFRNLGGTATQWEPVLADAGTLTTELILTKVSHSAGMIILNYEFCVRCQRRKVYSGETYFGFFQRAALALQVGIRDVQPFVLSAEQLAQGKSFPMPNQPPFPDERWRMIDRIEPLCANGGSAGLGFLRGIKIVRPDEWFFRAHFYRDPVWPGSLGLEAFLQLLSVAAAERGPLTVPPSPFEGEGKGVRTDVRHHIGLGIPHTWLYRGQVVPTNREVQIDADITNVDEQRKLIQADGYLSVDGRIIYQMKGFTLQG